MLADNLPLLKGYLIIQTYSRTDLLKKECLNSYERFCLYYSLKDLLMHCETVTLYLRHSLKDLVGCKALKYNTQAYNSVKNALSNSFVSIYYLRFY